MSRSPCVCHSLHSNCDPKHCDEAALTGSGSGLSSHAGLFPELLLRNANKGCLTCEVLYLSIASRAELKKENDVIQEALNIERRNNCVLLHYDRHSWEYFQEAQSGKPSERSEVLNDYSYSRFRRRGLWCFMSSL
jgi:hypothetical protein